MALISQALTTLNQTRLYLNLYTLTSVTSSETLSATSTAKITFQFDYYPLAKNYFGTFAEATGTASDTISTALLTIDYDLGTVTFSAARTGNITCSSYKYFAMDYSYDNILERIINSSSQLVISECGRNFISNTYTEWHKGDGRQKLLVDRFPINYITSVKEFSATLTAGTDYETSIQTYLDAGIVFNSDGWDYYGYQTGLVGDYTGEEKYIQVIYSAGYTLEPEASRTLPYDIEDCVLDIVSVKYNDYTNQRNGLKKLKEGELEYTWSDKSLIEQYSHVLNKYKKWVTPR